jgi:hypothetical protein
MGAEITNLRLARKARERAAAEAKAVQNRAAFGRSKAEKAKTAADTATLLRHVDGHKLTRDE